MTTTADVLLRYQELCDYCDAQAQRVRAGFNDKWQCRPGCSGCCQLNTVCGMEAVILLHAGISSRSLGQAWHAGEMCCLLRNDRCLIYENRPLICRTHGLPLVSSTLTEGEVDCCPLNLPALDGLSELDASLVLDLDRLTENLMRLNLVFFMVLGRPDLSDARFSLAGLARGENLPQDLLVAAGISPKP